MVHTVDIISILNLPLRLEIQRGAGLIPVCGFHPKQLQVPLPWQI